jgi:glucokinase
LRPGTSSIEPHSTVESVASGWGIAATAREFLFRTDDQQVKPSDVEDLLRDCGGDANQLTAVMIAEAAIRGNALARKALDRGVMTLGWAIAQVITLLAPEVVVVGGGVALIGDEWFFQPLREYAARFVFPPLANSYEIVPARLGEQVVVYGAIALASHAGKDSGCND